jgi:2-polyprenyl-3-methyl-5-hydroxy-6-metoxy-1,4-benzoquinol methylase
MTPCPVCETAVASPFIVREGVSIHQNLLVDTPAAARALNCGRLEMLACEACGFVFNSAFDPSLMQYGAAYENAQSHSMVFAAHVEGLARQFAAEDGAGEVSVVEIGCGNGAFLRAIADSNPNTRCIGLDPSYSGPTEALDGRVRFERRFFDDTFESASADIVICRHVIEHVPDPVRMLRLVKQCLRQGRGRAFFETPCVEWSLANGVLWDFFYEHCSYFTANSLAMAFARAGIAVESVRHVFGGQYLWLEARATEGAPAWPGEDGRVARLAAAFAREESSRIAALQQDIERRAADGGVAMWGAAAKGVTLAGLVDRAAALLSCVVDINPAKQGHFLPGTGHPIVPPAALRDYRPRWAVMTNPNYIEENRRVLRDAGVDVQLVDLMGTRSLSGLPSPGSPGQQSASAETA